jgi:hypothetical protein
MKLFISILIFQLSCCLSFAQTDSTITATDSLPKEKATLTLAALYANNASYFGQRAQETTPYAALSATFQFINGIYITGLAYKLLNDTTSAVSAASLGAGVTWKFNKKLSGDLRYVHSFYPKLSPLIQSVNKENISLGLKHNSWLETSVSGDYAFGETNDFFVTGGLAKDINLFSIGKKDIVSIKPALNMVAGTQRYYETYVTQQKLRDSLLGIITGPLLGSPTQTGNSTTVASSSFYPISYNFELPLSYSRSHYVVEAGYQLSLLSTKARSGAGKTNSFYTLSFYYQL